MIIRETRYDQPAAQIDVLRVRAFVSQHRDITADVRNSSGSYCYRLCGGLPSIARPNVAAGQDQLGWLRCNRATRHECSEKEQKCIHKTRHILWGSIVKLRDGDRTVTQILQRMPQNASRRAKLMRC
jgi:hypothetical protein